MTAIKKPLGSANTINPTSLLYIIPTPYFPVPMWSSRRGGGGGEERVSNSSRTTSSSLSKSSSSSSQSYSPFSANSSSSFQNNPRGKTMEDVWKDINGSPSVQEGQHHCTRQAREPNPNNNNTYHQNQSSFRGINLQEFLARPFHREQPSNMNEFCQFRRASAAAPPPPPPPPPPPVSFCLNTLLDFQYMENSGDPPPSNNDATGGSDAFGLNDASPFDAFGSGSAFASFSKKRGSESEDSTGDRRHKRMIKNRESAARSRARKQSYTNELEFQVDYLTKENERLLKQQQQLCLAAAAQVPKKRTLQRTSTAPF